MNIYEVVAIIDSNVDPEAMIEKVSNKLKSHECDVRKVDRWGKKRFAYEVNRRQYGEYFSVEFTANPKIIKELETDFRLTEDLLKCMIFRMDEKQIRQRSKEIAVVI